VLILVLAAVTLLTGGPSPLTAVWRTVFTPAEQSVAAVTRWGVAQYAKEYHFHRLEAENRDLYIRLAAQSARTRDARAARDENDRLRSLLDMPRRRRDLTLTPAHVTGFDNGNWSARFRIDRGTGDGVQPGMAVIDESYGVAGVVAVCGDDWAAVTGITDPAFRLGAQIERTKLACVASGSFGGMRNGKLTLTFVQDGEQPNTGDLAVTSGLTAAHPPGLIIGTVSALRQDDGGMGIEAVLKPSCDVYALRQVFVVTDFIVVN